MGLIETKQSILKLIREAEEQFAGTGKALLDIEDYVAEYLTANGVIVLPCKVGDDIWWFDEEKGDIACEKGGIKGVVYKGKTFEVLTEAGVEPIGTKFCNLSRKEAEAALKGVKDDK